MFIFFPPKKPKQKDIVAVKRALERYADLDPTFGTSREGQLLQVCNIVGSFVSTSIES